MIFKVQLKMTTMYDMEEVEKYKLYHVIKINALNRNQNKRIPYCVTCIISNKRFLCSCLIIEYSGILCAYILKILICLRIHRIPACYILNHWMKYKRQGGVDMA